MSSKPETASLWSRLPDTDVGMVPGPMKPGEQVDLGDGRTWIVKRVELRRLPTETHWALLVTPSGGRRWVQLQPSESTAGDEGSVLDLIRERLEMGRGVYGPLQVADDPRDWDQEALEELLDGCVYLAARLLQMRREAWLHDNPEALASVRRGLAQAKEGKLKPLDLTAAQAVAEQCEDG